MIKFRICEGRIGSSLYVPGNSAASKPTIIDYERGDIVIVQAIRDRIT
jgi:hypothetical protein